MCIHTYTGQFYHNWFRITTKWLKSQIFTSKVVWGFILWRAERAPAKPSNLNVKVMQQEVNLHPKTKILPSKQNIHVQILTGLSNWRGNISKISGTTSENRIVFVPTLCCCMQVYGRSFHSTSKQSTTYRRLVSKYSNLRCTDRLTRASIIHDSTNKFLTRFFKKMNSPRNTIYPNLPVIVDFKRSTGEFLFAVRRRVKIFCPNRYVNASYGWPRPILEQFMGNDEWLSPKKRISLLM